MVVMVDSDGGVAAVIVTVVVTMDIFIMIEVACVIAVDSTEASRRYRCNRKPQESIVFMWEYERNLQMLKYKSASS